MTKHERVPLDAPLPRHRHPRRPTTGTYKNPHLVARDELDLSEVRAHYRDHHARGRFGTKIPRANINVAAEHARDHHRHGSALPHIHEGGLVLVRDHEGRRPVGIEPRPLGWFTGQWMVTRAELKERFLARVAARKES